MARRILIEGKRHGLRPEWLAAVAQTESDFNPRVNGKAGEYGIFQVMLNEGGLQIAWTWLRAHSGNFPIVQSLPARMSWRKLRRHRIKVIRDIRAGTYLAAHSIARHVALCRRLGHRIGKYRCNKQFVSQCKRRYHPHPIDRLGHWQSGWRWPRAYYLRRIRKRSKIIARVLAGGTP